MKSWSLATILIVLNCLTNFGLALADAPRVVASIRPLHSLVSSVMEGVASPKLLISDSSSPHSYTLRPSDALTLDRAEIVFWFGPELETFLQKPLQALASDAVQISMVDQPSLYVLPGRNTRGDKLKIQDPHLWLDPVNAIAMVRVIAATIQQADKANHDLYVDNAERIIEALEKLNVRIKSDLAPLKNIPFITFHDAFQYFEERYKLNSVGFVLTEPEHISSAKYVKEITQQIAELRPVCIFTDSYFEPDLLESLASGTDLRRATLDPIGFMLSPGPDLYFDLMQSIIDSFTHCLGSFSHAN
ncbi:MAG: zinc ABC transporter substrate-binding protein [Candidatus Marinimicrobia bacterium]|nr:zinc ABC transporter substrate-binding protein [Candidatus Neomarinimicrobiota bacterium]